MRQFISSPLFIVLLFAMEGCTPPIQTVQTEILYNIPTSITTNTLIPSFTPTLTQQPSDTPTPTPKVKVHEIVPISSTCDVTTDKSVFTAAWKNDNEIVYAYYPVIPLDPQMELTLMSGGVAPKVDLQWVSYNTKTGSEKPGVPFINFDNTFWERNQIKTNAINPELTGQFSPSGKYVLYSIIFGNTFEPDGRTEIWVAETKGHRKWKIYESHAPLYIPQAAWFDDETKVIFDLSYEGPVSIYISDFELKKTTELSGKSQFSGLTEEDWKLSPDGSTLAVVDLNRNLLLVSLVSGETQIVEPYGGNLPEWSEDGRYLFYWWRADPNNWRDEVDELRVYDTNDQRISTLLEKSDLVAGFSDYQSDGNCIAGDYFLYGGNYSVSPNQKEFLFWQDYLYLITKE
jgi:hypothetical protein